MSMAMSVLSVLGGPVDLGAAPWLDATVPVRPHAASQASAFGLAHANAEAVRFGPADDDVLDVRRGASVNCERLTVCCHVSSTHTECAGHITRDRVSVQECPLPLVMQAGVVSVPVTLAAGGDRVLTREALEAACARSRFPRGARALVVRALGEYGPDVQLTRDFTGTNPPYFAEAAMRWLCEHGVQHLVVDLPSVERENSSPDMASHSIFFGLEPGCKSASKSTRPGTTITELANLHGGVPDGPCLLSLQVAPVDMDAAPSRVLLLPGRDRSKTLGLVAALVVGLVVVTLAQEKSSS